MPLVIVLLMIGGVIEALLLSRLVLRLLAARPDNPVFAVLFMWTAPLTAPLTALDAGQPRFGAVLELSTLALCAFLALAMIVVALLGRRRTIRGTVQ